MANVTSVLIMHSIAILILFVVFYILLSIKRKNKCIHTKQQSLKSLTGTQLN